MRNREIVTKIPVFHAMGINFSPNIPNRRSRIAKDLKKRINRVKIRRKSQIFQIIGVNDKPNDHNMK